MFFLPRGKMLYSVKKGVSVFVVICFLWMTLFPSIALAQSVVGLPVPGAILNITSSFTPLMLRGIQINPKNPFEFNFLLDTGSDSLDQDESFRLRQENEDYAKQIKEKISGLEKEKVLLEQRMSTVNPQDSVQLDELKNRNAQLQDQNKFAQSELIKTKARAQGLEKICADYQTQLEETFRNIKT